MPVRPERGPRGASRWSPGRRDLLIALGVGLAVLAFVAWAVVSLSRKAASSDGVEGAIVRKEFVARSEQQITVGRGGRVRPERAPDPADGGQTYRVCVSAPVHESHHEGERYYFIRPKPGS